MTGTLWIDALIGNIVAVLAASAFGYWQSSIAAGIFVFCAIFPVCGICFAVEMLANDYRNIHDSNKSPV